jgi:BON domain-containing protein
MLKKRDSEIEQWVLRELRLSKQICSSEVCVFSRDGVVSLSGSAESDYDKLAIEKATLGATGVIGVLNELKVKLCTALIQKQPLSLELPTPGVFLHVLAAQEATVKPYLEAAVATSKY